MDDIRDEIRMIRELNMVKAAQIAPDLKASMIKRLEAAIREAQASVKAPKV